MDEVFQKTTFNEYKEYLSKIKADNDKVRNAYALLDDDDEKIDSVLQDQSLTQREIIEIIALCRRVNYAKTAGGANKAAENETDRLYAKNPWKFVEEFLQNADDCNYSKIPKIDIVINTILNSKTPVYTYCNGYAMSAAFQVFLAGHKRFISSHVTLMYHQIYCWRSGKYQDLVEDRQHMDHLNDQIEKYVIDRTKLTQSDLDAIREKKRDTYFTADEAIKLGIADAMMDGSENLKRT